ncbi:hypothetical protein OG689_10650 [Kitasatospora sp. NBC_00240]|uniref:hypothetical protein n=1 Tax=Kitasatospora sp. NBC_00240 TaxID=2903567 RepID=UPI00225AFE8B|nr:hypothetical protein [Kitasatospora sp. NBC_00240]MCX5209742.1 hypothetical protein [Kitasatospora sp. NBC_00240]
MTARPVTVWIVACDGCGRELGQGYGHRETYEMKQEATCAALHSGWQQHPDGSLYCPEGQHQ